MNSKMFCDNRQIPIYRELRRIKHAVYSHYNSNKTADNFMAFKGKLRKTNIFLYVFPDV